MRSWVIAAAFAGAMAAAGTATADDAALAEVLFREGRTLLDQGKTVEACAKLAESLRLDRSSGTLINLALCHETEGKTATAWGEYITAARLARAQNKADRASEADKRAETLEPRVARVRVPAPTGVPGAIVVRDGEALGAAVFGTRMPLDAGKHVIEVRVDGRKTWSRTVTIVDGQQVDLPEPDVPLLEASPVLPPVVVPPPAPPRRAETSPAFVAGWALVATSLLTLGAGAALGGSALSEYGRYESACPSFKGCSAEAIEHYSRADSLGWGANVVIPVGLAAGIAGVVLVVTQRPSARRATALPSLQF